MITIKIIVHKQNTLMQNTLATTKVFTSISIARFSVLSWSYLQVLKQLFTQVNKMVFQERLI